MRVAAIDCGTNSIRLLVADIDGGGLTDVVRRMEIVRLGQGVDRTGSLAPEAIERTRVALADYAAQTVSLGVDPSRIRMVATSATRDAANADDFTAMVVATLGVAPEVVSGDEEARLSFTGAVQGLPDSSSGPRHSADGLLVVDIGGGSTEFVTGSTAGGVERAISTDIGCVRMTERHLHDDPPTAAQVAAAEADITAVVAHALSTVRPSAVPTVVGLAGSVTTVTALALSLDSYRPERIHHARISTAVVASVTDDLLRLTHDERLALPVMHPGRADVIAAGAMILRAILRESGAVEVIASEHDILDGIACSIVD